jgi:gluconolactonase
MAAARQLVWSDIPNNRLMRWLEDDGHVSVFRQPSGYANGNSIDRSGRLVTCEHFQRRLTRTEHDGGISVLADGWEGKPLNSPNDVAVDALGAVWFTDPDYGIMSDYEGGRALQEQDGCFLYRIDPSGALTLAADGFVRPNGLTFSPCGNFLYVVDSGGSHTPEGPRHIRRFQVTSDGELSKGEIFAECEKGIFDGIRCDEHGRVWTSAPEGVRCYEPEGDWIGTIIVPELTANLEFGGLRRNRLFIAATTSVYAIYLRIRGA